MPDQIGLELAPSALFAAPGGPAATATITILNQRPVVEQIALQIEGLDPAWPRLSEHAVNLFPGEQVQVRLDIQAPAGAPGGRYPFTVRASSRQDPFIQASAGGTLEVAAVQQLQLELVPQRRQSRGPAVYTVRLTNGGNMDLRVRLDVQDPEEALRWECRPEALAVPAGGQATAELRVRPRRGRFMGAPESHSFALAAFPLEGERAEPFGVSAGEYVHTPLPAVLAGLPLRLRTAALLGLPLLAVAALLIWLLAGPGQAPERARPTATPTPPSLAGAQDGAGGRPAPSPTLRPPVILSFTANLPADGAPLRLSWEVQGAESVRVVPKGSSGAPRSFDTLERAEYTLIASNAGGTTTSDLVVYVLRPPSIDDFSLQAQIVTLGDKTYLRWKASRAERLFLDGQPLNAAEGEVEIEAGANREFELRAENLAGAATRRIPLIVKTPSPTPTPTPTPEPTSTPTPTVPRPTNTPRPTDTPRPTAPPAQPTQPPAQPTTPPAIGGEPCAGPAVGDALGVNESFFASTLARGLGAQWTRWIIAWEGVQPNGPQDFNDFYVDPRVLDREIANGFRLAGMVKNTPRWAARNPDDGPRSVPRNLDLPVFLPNGQVNPENYWAAFTSELARRYAGKINVWIIWNEIEIPPDGPNAAYNTWTGTTEEYYRLLKVAYQAIKRTNPNATVVLAPFSFHRNKGWWQEFLTIARADPEGPANGFFFDVMALNLYRNPHDVWDRMFGAPWAYYPEDRPGAQQIMSQFGISKPVWLTEINSMPYDDPNVPGWDPRAKNDQFRVTMDEQASAVIQWYALALAAGYQKVFWQAMQDDRPPVPDELWGLVRYHPDMLNADARRLRPAYHAYQVMAEALNGARCVKLVTLNRPDLTGQRQYAPRFEWLVHLVVAEHDGRRASILWNGSGDPITVSIPKVGTSAEAVDKYGNRTPLQPSPDGARWVVTLDAATRHFNHPVFGSDPEGYYYVGGSPLIIDERGVPPNAPVQAPQRA